MCSVFHDIPLIHYDVLLSIFNDKFLVDDFHSIELAIFFESAQKDLGKASRTDHFNNLETV